MGKKKRQRKRRPSRARDVTKREERHILYLIDQGKTVGEILRVSGRGYYTVRDIAERNGRRLGEKIPAIPTAEQQALMVELGGKGLGYAKIARLLGLSEKTVRNHLQKEGIFVGRGGLLSPAIQAEPVFPDSDDFHLTPAERARLEYIRQLKKAKWEHLHPEKGKENEHDTD